MMCRENNKYYKIVRVLVCAICTFLCVSCSSVRNIPSDINEKIVYAEHRLNVPITIKDDVNLMYETAQWIGTPYRNGGMSRSGVDCSGFVACVYNNVYHKKLYHNSLEQYKQNCKKVRKGKLQEGDLVFFKTVKKGKKISHSGIYLKNHKFVHASTSHGVIVSDLREKYYKKHWVAGGKVK